MNDRAGYIPDEEICVLQSRAANNYGYHRKVVIGGESTFLPRRVLHEHKEPLERQIDACLFAVEASGAHRILTEVSIMLDLSRRFLADWIDLGKPGAVLAPMEAFGRDAQRLDGEATKAGNSSNPKSPSGDTHDN